MLKRSPSLMMLLELAAMLLVFSLCAAVTVRVFYEARVMTLKSYRIGAAADIAQIAAESFRADGDIENVVNKLSAVRETERYTAEYVWNQEIYTVYLYPRNHELDISVCFDGVGLYELTVGAL